MTLFFISCTLIVLSLAVLGFYWYKNKHRATETKQMPPHFDIEELPTGQLLRNHNYLHVMVRDKLLTYDSDAQSYFYDGKQLIFIGDSVAKLFPAFDLERHAESVAQKEGHTPLFVKEKWNAESEEARKSGEFFHRQVEAYLNGHSPKVSYPFVFLGKECKISRPISIIPEINQFIQFWTTRTLTPYRSGWIVYDEDWGVVGHVDLLAKDSEGHFLLFDWTRSRTFGEEADDGFVVSRETPFPSALSSRFSLSDTPFNRSYVQMNWLRTILSRRYGIEVHQMFVVVFHANNRNYHSVEIPIAEFPFE